MALTFRVDKVADGLVAPVYVGDGEPAVDVGWAFVGRDGDQARTTGGTGVAVGEWDDWRQGGRRGRRW